MSLTNFKKVCTFRLDLFALLGLICILCALGRWQLHRALEKETILHIFEQTQKLPERVWRSSEPNPLSFQKILVSGRWVPQVFYLDNQFHGHQVGYEIYVPMQLESLTVLLVNVGWLAAGADRNQLPVFNIKLPPAWQGSVYYPKMSKVDLGYFLDRKVGNNYIIERLDTKKIGDLLSQKVLPWVVKTSVSPETIVRVAPKKHYAYALQWFVMALGVLILLIWRLIKK